MGNPNVAKTKSRTLRENLVYELVSLRMTVDQCYNLQAFAHIVMTEAVSKRLLCHPQDNHIVILLFHV